MSLDFLIDLATIVVAGLVALALIEKTPAIVNAIADVRAAGDRSLDGLVPEDVADALAEVCTLAAIRRADPDMPDELVERLALTVLEDARDGLLGMSETADPRGDA